MKIKFSKTMLLVASCLTFFSAAANANISVYTGNYSKTGDVQNVKFTNTDQSTQATTMVVGWTEKSHDFVNFTSNENIHIDGQRILADDGAFGYLKFNMADSALGFNIVQFNLDHFDGSNSPSATFRFTDQLGTIYESVSWTLTNGQNKFTAIADGDSIIKSVEISALGNTNIQALSDVQQIRLNPVPIPSTLLLLGSSLIGLVGIGRRRNKK